MHRTVLIIVLFLCCPVCASRADRAKQAGKVLQMDRLLTIRIHMTAEQWRLMQPQHASRLAVAMAVVQHPTTRQALDAGRSKKGKKAKGPTPVDGERRPPGLVGNQYAYIGATVDIDGQTYKDVGVRFKGQWSYSLAGNSPRRPLKLSFDHFVPNQTFSGIQSLSLNTNALDPSQLRESLGYAFFRDAGIPAPRTCFAMLYLTVDGVYKNELLGLYTVIEEVNKDFLHSRFGTSKGLVIRPERTRNLAYFGSDWKDYSRYNLQTDASRFTASRFIAFTRLINHADDETFAAEIGNYVDIDQFLRFIAANVLMINLDGVLVNGHNFYIFIHPKTGQLSFIPWDLHLAFGWYGKTLDEWVGLTIDRPYRSGNRLVERVMKVNWMREAYRAYLRQFAEGYFSPERMHARIEQLEQVVHKAEAIAQAEGKTLPPTVPSNPNYPRAELKPFVTGRVQSVFEQLAGRIEGDPVGGRPAKPAPPPKPAPKPVGAPVPKPVAKAAPKPAATQPAAKPAARPTAAASMRAAVAAVMPPATRPAAIRTVRTPQPVSAKATTRPAQAATPAAPKGRPAVTTKPKTQVAPPPRPAKAAKAVTPPPPKPRPLPLYPLATVVLRDIDSNQDNQLTRDELADATKHIFIASARIQRKGPLDETALAATFDYIGTLLDPFPPSVNDAAPAESPLRPRPALIWARAIMSRTDAGNSAHDTLLGLLAAADKMFLEADSNHDGLLNVQEISAFLDQLVPRR